MVNTLPNAPAVTANSVSVALATDQAPVQVVGKCGIDQTTPGVTNAIVVTGGAISLIDRSGYIRGGVIGATVQTAGGAAGHIYSPGDTLILPTGAGVVAPAALTVATTQVVAATVAAGGTGGANGTQTVIGTTGTGIKFQASVTVAGGAITAVLSIAAAGSYTVNPTTPAAEPVSGGSLAGAQLNLIMGAATLTVSAPGIYGAPQTNPIVPVSTSGSGSGVAVNLMSFSPLSTPVFSSNSGRQYFMFRNESSSQNLGASIGATAAFGAVGTTTFGPNGDGWSEAGGRIPSNAIALIGGTAFQQFTAWEG
ncbi:hypothetical protein [Methylocapsa acidiphila]|uniref:hypothetical protein n=1 Tax=Methylocapsa acidiphila TaxID=133552 RepID=UPI001AEBD1F2|nr:hypothetical protein [Methylocapsa acidiphila]